MTEKSQLFNMPTHVKGSIDRRGRVRSAHLATRKKKIAAAEQSTQRAESTLDKFIGSHGGAEHLRTTLNEMTPEQRAKLIDAMAYVGNVNHDAVLDKLGMRTPPQKSPQEERQQLVDRLGRGVAGDFIDEGDSKTVLDAYDKGGAAVALDTLRGILKKKKEESAEDAEAVEPDGSGPYTHRIITPTGGLASEHRSLANAEKAQRRLVKMSNGKLTAAAFPIEAIESDTADETGRGFENKFMYDLRGDPEKARNVEGYAEAWVAAHAAGQSAGKLRMNEGDRKNWNRADYQSATAEFERVFSERMAAGPQEGATKTEDGVDYVLRDGRWHRVTPVEPVVAATAEMPAPAAVAMEEAPADIVAEELATNVAIVVAPSNDDLDPSSPNYRYRDTGYVGGSRKEEAALMIRSAARAGAHVRVTDIDWEEIEKNPREAAELITKKNIFGDVDWMALSQTDMTPGAGFILQKIYASVGADPKDDTAASRKDFSLGIDSLRNRLEACKSIEDVSNTLDEIKNERDGIILTDSEQFTYEALTDSVRRTAEEIHRLDAASDALYQKHLAARTVYSRLKFDIEKREIRKWKVDPEMQQQLIDAQRESEALSKEWHDFRDANGMQGITHQHKTPRGIESTFEYPYRKEYERLSRNRQFIISEAQKRNQLENPLTRAWNSLGESFNAVIDYRRTKGSQAFAKHLTSAKAGRVKDWSWAETGSKEPRAATKRSVAFQLLVADTFERVGGREIAVDSTASLKNHFSLREVQSGNWVLDDPNSAKFHVEHCARAFADLADILGISDQNTSFNGRLAMAFGARGRGNTGGSAAKAHYEPIQRVINLTKMAGGGSLAHEWFHFVDNLVKEATTGIASNSEDFATQNANMLDDPQLKDAFAGLTAAMMEGPHRKTAVITYTESEEKWAHHNMASYSGGSIRDRIRSANGVQDALNQIDAMHARGNFGNPEKKRAEKMRDTWRTIAAIHHGGNASREIRYETGPGMSMFALEATDLDRGVAGKYWSAPHELAARAFSSYIEDKLAGAGRQNTYLVSMANNKVYQALGLPSRPFPEGGDRERINGAFDRLFTALRERDVLAKALELFTQI